MTNHNIVENIISPELIPEAVIDTALTTTNGSITIIFPDNYTYNAVIIFYYAELDALANATSRQFYFQAPDFIPLFFNPIVNTSGLFSASYEVFFHFDYTAGWDIVLDPTIYSPLGPLVNALEVLEVSESVMAILTKREDGELLFCLLSTSFLMLSKFSSEDTPTFHTEGIVSAFRLPCQPNLPTVYTAIQSLCGP
jgi:hypothetical protein